MTHTHPTRTPRGHHDPGLKELLSLVGVTDLDRGREGGSEGEQRPQQVISAMSSSKTSKDLKDSPQDAGHHRTVKQSSPSRARLMSQGLALRDELMDFILQHLDLMLMVFQPGPRAMFGRCLRRDVWRSSFQEDTLW